jgi:hypothetical protein
MRKEKEMLPGGIARYTRLQNEKEQDEVATSGIVKHLYTASLHINIKPLSMPLEPF